VIAISLATQALGMTSGTSHQTLGFNKPTAFEFVVVTKGKAMRVCAPSQEDEVRISCS
jgi:hypothetical protein